MKGLRKKLTIIVGLLAATGIGIAAIPFIASMNPSAKAIAEKEAWNNPPMPELKHGQVVVRQISNSRSRENLNGSTTPIFGERDLLIRDNNGFYYSYRLPTWENAVLVPRLFWGQWEYMCNDFGPETVNGTLVENANTIQCNNAGKNNWVPVEAKWSINGKSLKKPYPDLPTLRCKKMLNGNLKCI